VDNFYQQCGLSFYAVDNTKTFLFMTCGKLFCFMIESEDKNKEGELIE